MLQAHPCVSKSGELSEQQQLNDECRKLKLLSYELFPFVAHLHCVMAMRVRRISLCHKLNLLIAKHVRETCTIIARGANGMETQHLTTTDLRVKNFFSLILLLDNGICRRRHFAFNTYYLSLSLSLFLSSADTHSFSPPTSHFGYDIDVRANSYLFIGKKHSTPSATQ